MVIEVAKRATLETERSPSDRALALGAVLQAGSPAAAVETTKACVAPEAPGEHQLRFKKRNGDSALSWRRALRCPPGEHQWQWKSFSLPQNELANLPRERDDV